jgi:hypothetical protein
MKLEFSLKILEKYANTKVRENPSSGSRVVPCGQTDGQTKPIFTFLNSANAPKKSLHLPYFYKNFHFPNFAPFNL